MAQVLMAISHDFPNMSKCSTPARLVYYRRPNRLLLHHRVDQAVLGGAVHKRGRQRRDVRPRHDFRRLFWRLHRRDHPVGLPQQQLLL